VCCSEVSSSEKYHVIIYNDGLVISDNCNNKRTRTITVAPTITTSYTVLPHDISTGGINNNANYIIYNAVIDVSNVAIIAALASLGTKMLFLM